MSFYYDEVHVTKMKAFMNEDFMLKNETAKKLYNEYAKDMPIYDYHCHLSAKEIAENKSYEDLTEIWLGGDHYKWRAMRSNGVGEAYMTGDKPSKDKFMKWAETVPYTIGNPLYHWTHLELKRYFGIEETLSPTTAESIWKHCNEKLQQPDMTARALITKSKVKVICTTDDPIDNLEYHIQLANDNSFETKVVPTFRPDKSFNVDVETFMPWIKSLQNVVGYEVDSLDKLLNALEERINFFHEVGCRLSDHALDTIEYSSPNKEKAEEIFIKGSKGEVLSKKEVAAYKGYILNFLGKAYAARGWAMQLHIGALRNNNRRMYDAIGPDTGFDSIHDSTFAPELSRLLNDLDATDELPKTIIYTLNPRDNYVIGTMIGNFQGGGTPGKIQFGSGWWFCDQKEGMIDQMKSLSSLGLISRFVGMLTDSRSFLSYTRHEYFRRILCNLIGEWIEEGEYPNDLEFVGGVVKDICYNNAVNYFEI